MPEAMRRRGCFATINHSAFPDALLAISVVEATCWIPYVRGQEVEVEQQATDPLGADVAGLRGREALGWAP